MTEVNPHFLTVRDWAEAEEVVGFSPLRPQETPTSLRIHVKDHRMREVAPTLETYFEGYVLTQAQRDVDEANRLAGLRYGAAPRAIEVSGHSAVVYELGPEPPADDIDPRSPAIVVWADGDIFVMLASETLPVDDLLEVANSLYPAGR